MPSPGKTWQDCCAPRPGRATGSVDLVASYLLEASTLARILARTRTHTKGRNAPHPARAHTPPCRGHIRSIKVETSTQSCSGGSAPSKTHIGVCNCHRLNSGTAPTRGLSSKRLASARLIPRMSDDTAGKKPDSFSSPRVPPRGVASLGDSGKPLSGRRSDHDAEVLA